MSSDCESHDDNPAWARGLKKYGNYYEGIVESAELALEMHKQETVTLGQKSQNHYLQFTVTKRTRIIQKTSLR